MEGEAEDEHDEAGGGRKRDRQRRVGTPRPQRITAPLHDGKLAIGWPQHAYGGERRTAIRERDLQSAGAEVRERLAQSKDIEQRAAPKAACGGRAGDDPPFLIGNEDVPVTGRRPGGQGAPQHVFVTLIVDYLAECESVGENFRERIDVERGSGERLTAVVHYLHSGANADGDQEGDDESGNGAAKSRLGGEEAAIGRLGK